MAVEGNFYVGLVGPSLPLGGSTGLKQREIVWTCFSLATSMVYFKMQYTLIRSDMLGGYCKLSSVHWLSRVAILAMLVPYFKDLDYLSRWRYVFVKICDSRLEILLLVCNGMLNCV